MWYYPLSTLFNRKADAMPPNAEVEIMSWSYMIHTASRNYRCDNCAGMIPRGTKYLRRKIRGSTEKFKGGIKTLHEHQDCQMPWYQTETGCRTRNWGQLPGRTPPKGAVGPDTAPLQHVVSFSNPETGMMMWRLPQAVQDKLMNMPRADIRLGALAEIEQNLMLVLQTFLSCHGNQKKAMQLSHLLNDMQALTTPPLPSPKKRSR